MILVYILPSSVRTHLTAHSGFTSSCKPFKKMRHQKPEIFLNLNSLIVEIDKAGIEISYSCREDESGYFHLDFPSFFEVTKFLRIAAKNQIHSNSLYEQIFVPEKMSWKYDVEAVDVSVIINDTDLKSYNDESEDAYVMDFEFCVRIPKSDYDAVMKSFKNYNN